MNSKNSANLIDALEKPMGSVGLHFKDDLGNSNIQPAKILEYVVGNRIYRITRTKEKLFYFFYASPGAGTQVAVLDIKECPHCASYNLCFSWSPDFISLGIAIDPVGTFSIGAKGVPCSFDLQVDTNGRIHQVGDLGVQAREVRVLLDGQPVLNPPAIKAWDGTLEAIQILDSGTSAAEWMLEVVATNLTLVILVTGFEAYLKTRFLELEDEGATVNTNAIVEKFWSRKNREENTNLMSSRPDTRI